MMRLLSILKKLSLAIGVALFVFHGNTSAGSVSPMDLAVQYAPLVNFHPNEEFYPCSVEWFLQRSRLVRVWKKEVTTGPVITGSAQVEELVPLGQVTVQSMSTHSSSDVSLDLMGNYETYKGMPLRGSESPAPVYCRIITHGADKVILQYWFFYSYNGPFSPIAVSKKIPIGIHEGDWETISLYLQKEQNDWQIKSVYLARHGRERGEHIVVSQANPLEFQDKTHPIIYAAKYGHASYPKTKKLLPTSDGDLVAKGSVTWPTWKNVVIINDQTPFVQFKGRWGLIGGGPYGPADKPIWESYPTDDKGNLNRQDPHTVLKEIEGINLNSGKPQYFDMDISTHYFKVCWVLEKKVGNEWKPVNDIHFDVKEKKRIGSDKTWYSIQNETNCFDVNMELRALKNFYVRRTGGAAVNPGDQYKLVVKGLEP